MAENQKINECEFTRIARSIDSISYLVQDVVERYFERFNVDNKEDHFGITWEYNRNRAKMEAVQELLFLCNEELEKLGIDVYKKGGGDTE